MQVKLKQMFYVSAFGIVFIWMQENMELATKRGTVVSQGN